MLRVLQHYLPVRTAMLFFGETVLLWLVAGAGMSQHLWEMLMGIRGANSRELHLALGRLGLDVEGGFWVCVISALMVTVICQIAIGFNGLYEFHISSSRYERAARFVESAGAGIALTLVAVGLANFWGFHKLLAFPGLSLSQKLQALVGSLVTGFGVLYLWRIFFHAFTHRVDLDQRLLILGSRGPAHELANQVLEHPEAGYKVVGLVPEPTPAPGTQRRRAGDPTDRAKRPERIHAPGHVETEASRALLLDAVMLGSLANQDAAMSDPGKPGGQSGLLELARERQVDVLVVALEDRRQTLPTEELLRCRLGGIDVREREEIFEQITGRIAVAAMRPSYLIFNEGFRRHPWAELMKRVVDIVLALTILLVSWPCMLLTAMMVKLDSPGSALFKQERVGQDGTPFTLMKFRSMRNDAEKLTGAVWATEDDPRITRVGRFIRKTRLDELPQLFNVLSGTMSLVGPRPERAPFVQDLAARIPYYHQRHIVKPGLTGWAQINYPYGNTMEDALHKLQYDLFYIKNHSVLFDLSILFSTIKTVVLRRGT
jgi:lipopolysaccharide/colanic/teichoic acid biosynthesis glycosyltransferase